MLSTKRNIERATGVTDDSNMDVPDIPLSYNPTGFKNKVIPQAFIMPARVSIITFLILIFFIIYCYNFGT